MNKLLIPLILTSTMLGTNAYAKDITGSIELSAFQDEASAFNQTKVSIEDAVEIARKASNGTKVMRAELERSYGYLVWEIAILGENKTVHQVIIDPVTSDVLYQESWRE